MLDTYENSVLRAGLSLFDQCIEQTIRWELTFVNISIVQHVQVYTADHVYIVPRIRTIT